MMRNSTRPPGSTLTTSGSASVRSLARKASYLTSLRSGAGAAGGAPPPFFPPPPPFCAGAAPAHLHAPRRHLRRRGRAHFHAPAHLLRRSRAGGGHAAHRPHLLQVGEDLFGTGEGEIGEHHHDFLLVGAVALIVDDKRRGHQELLLQVGVRMHPERAAVVKREIVVGAAPRRNERRGNVRHAVLLPRRR